MQFRKKIPTKLTWHYHDIPVFTPIFQSMPACAISNSKRRS
uniref:Uncharacterized protein n=1 Tax=Heterorhabditis bacteriophora TaxID=37862 RepID=A0A1I7W7H6_HETBA